MGSVIANISQYMKDSRNGNATANETNMQLYERLSARHPVGIRAFQTMFAKECGRNFATNRITTPDEAAKMAAKYSGKDNFSSQAPKAGNSKPVADVSPAATSPKKPKNSIDWHTVSVRALFGLGALGHAVLIWWECGYLWGQGGAIAGSVVFVVIAASILQMSKKPQGETAQNLLYLVWLLDLCAWFVHKHALYHGGTNAYGSGITEYGTGCLALVICVCAGAMVYFFRETGLEKTKK